MKKYHYNNKTQKITICRSLTQCNIAPPEHHGETPIIVKSKIENPHKTPPPNKDINQIQEDFQKVNHNLKQQGIYGAFTNTGECLYIGLSENIGVRVKQHVQALKRGSKTKKHWPAHYKNNTNELTWLVIELIHDRTILNSRERYWWHKLTPPYNEIPPHEKNYKTGGNTSKKFPGTLQLMDDIENYSIAELSLHYGVTKSCIYGWIRDNNIEIPEVKTISGMTRDFLSDNYSVIIKELESYAPLTVIARKYKIDRLELMALLKANNIPYGYNLSKTRITREEILKELDKNTKLNKISSKYGIIHNHLRKMLKEYHIDVKER